jgi:hypothetical protein
MLLFRIKKKDLAKRVFEKVVFRVQILHALAASCVQSRQFFASTLRELLFE